MQNFHLFHNEKVNLEVVIKIYFYVMYILCRVHQFFCINSDAIDKKGNYFSEYFESM